MVQTLVHSHSALVSSVLALEATEVVSGLVTQMALEVIDNHHHFSTPKNVDETHLIYSVSRIEINENQTSTMTLQTITKTLP